MIESICSNLDTECKKSQLKCRAYMMLIGNYGGHMAIATDPPYCVAYAADYKNNDPSKMTPCEPLNHAYAMVTSNMVVRRLCLYPTGSQLTGNLLKVAASHSERRAVWPRVVSQNSHTAQPCGSTCRFSHKAGGPVSDYWAFLSHRYDFPGLPGIWNCLLPRKWPS